MGSCFDSVGTESLLKLIMNSVSLDAVGEISRDLLAAASSGFSLTLKVFTIVYYLKLKISFP